MANWPMRYDVSHPQAKSNLYITCYLYNIFIVQKRKPCGHGAFTHSCEEISCYALMVHAKSQMRIVSAIITTICSGTPACHQPTLFEKKTCLVGKVGIIEHTEIGPKFG